MKEGDKVRIKTLEELSKKYGDLDKRDFTIIKDGPYFVKEMKSTCGKIGKILYITTRGYIRVEIDLFTEWSYLEDWIIPLNIDKNGNYLLWN